MAGLFQPTPYAFFIQGLQDYGPSATFQYYQSFPFGHTFSSRCPNRIQKNPSANGIPWWKI